MDTKVNESNYPTTNVPTAFKNLLYWFNFIFENQLSFVSSYYWLIIKIIKNPLAKNLANF